MLHAFHTYTASILSRCLRMFCNIFSSVFHVLLQGFQKHISCVSSVFGHMLQTLYFDVSKLERLLYMGTRVGSRRGTNWPRAQSGDAGDAPVAREASRGTLVDTYML
jgi:hypothetical protein